jgi:hypothetical protein
MFRRLSRPPVHRRRQRFTRRFTSFGSAVTVAVLLSFPGASTAQAATEAAPLSLAAVGQGGSYFDVTISAGSTLQLEVARSNPGSGAVTAHSYVGSVFTIVNGGFGATDSGETMTGASAWVDYPDEVFSLDAGVTDTKAFTVTVPTGTLPGEYISSIVLQNNDALPGEGQVALDRVIRQAVAISIRVPGALEPDFSLGAASHDTVGGRSVVSVELGNEGNQHLKPAGTMTVKDATKTVVSEAPVTMGSVYAGMDTSVAVTLGGLLLPGEYTVTLVLADPSTGVTASITDVPFTVVDPPTEIQSAVAQLPAIVQDVIEKPLLRTLILVLAALLVLGLALVVTLRIRRWAKKRAAALAVSTENGETAI